MLLAVILVSQLAIYCYIYIFFNYFAVCSIPMIVIFKLKENIMLCVLSWVQ